MREAIVVNSKLPQPYLVTDTCIVLVYSSRHFLVKRALSLSWLVWLPLWWFNTGL